MTRRSRGSRLTASSRSSEGPETGPPGGTTKVSDLDQAAARTIASAPMARQPRPWMLVASLQRDASTHWPRLCCWTCGCVPRVHGWRRTQKSGTRVRRAALRRAETHWSGSTNSSAPMVTVNPPLAASWGVAPQAQDPVSTCLATAICPSALEVGRAGAPGSANDERIDRRRPAGCGETQVRTGFFECRRR